MELVYLWVEKYKNIKEQGFNFSSRFNCHYDGEILTIDENDDYIKNFFGENINVTAIVGKNGSGKSSILEVLTMLMSQKSLDSESDNKFFGIIYDGRNKTYGQVLWNYDDVNSNQTLNPINSFNIFTFHYNYNLDYIHNNEKNIDFNNFYNKEDDYQTPILLQPDKSDANININNLDYLAIRDILEFTINGEQKFENIEKFFTPEYCKLSIDWEKIYKKQATNQGIFYKKLIDIMGDKWFYLNQTVSSLSRQKLILCTKVYIIQKTYEKEFVKSFDFIKDEKFKVLMTSVDDESLNNAMEYIDDKSFEELYGTELSYKMAKIKQAFLFLKFLTKQKSEYEISDDLINIYENNELLLNIAPWVSIDYFNENSTSLYSLSYGQKFLIRFIYSLINQLDKVKDYGYQNIFLLLDEVELGLHPQWQKEYLTFILNVLSNLMDYKFYLICSSHSPFLISDLPKENVIFLKDGKEHKGLDSETFGANIHTLLSDSFFMEDGLMGEFAKKKINEIKKLYDLVQREEVQKRLQENNTKECAKKAFNRRKNRLWQIQKIIGEPFLQRVIGNYLDELELIFSDDNTLIQKELDEIEERKNYLLKLKEESNNDRN